MDSKSFEEKELKILREAIDNASSILGKKTAQSPIIQEIIKILEDFLRSKKTLCYGGTAINNILPEQYRFYNKNIEIPDYDFFSPHALKCAKELADIYYKAGYEEVEAKAGVHEGTYKVYVNFIPIADITYMEKNIFNNLHKQSIKINAINYCPPNFLRMAMYQELSRPMGDVSRWEKVLKRLILLNKNFPLKGIECKTANFQRKYEGSLEERDEIYNIVRKSVSNQGLIFFGGYAASLYGKYMPKKEKRIVDTIPDFDILADNPYVAANILKEQLIYEGYTNVKVDKKNMIGEFIDFHYEIKVNKDVIAYVYKTNACHSYNIIHINGQKINVASIDTMLSFYLIFIYADRPYYDENRLLCMSEYLFKVQLKNRLEQKGLLQRFSVNCHGKHSTLEDIRENKANKYHELKSKNLGSGTPEYDKYFLRYIPKEVNHEEKEKEKEKVSHRNKLNRKHNYRGKSNTRVKKYVRKPHNKKYTRR